MLRAKHIKLTEKQFEMQKRAEFKLLQQAFYGPNGIMMGNFYLPCEVSLQLGLAWQNVKKAYTNYLIHKSHRKKAYAG